MSNRVFVTGMGVVSPLGNNVHDSFDAAVHGRSSITKELPFDSEKHNLSVRFGGVVKGYKPSDFAPERELRRFDSFIGYAMGAVHEAVEQAKLDEKVDPERVGVIFGSGIGGMVMVGNAAVRLEAHEKLSPFTIPGSIINMLPGYLTIKYGWKGPNFATVSACSTSAHAIAVASMMLQQGLCDVVVTGGSEACLNPLGFASFHACRALSTRNDDPEGASRPWDKNRDGFVMSDGAACLILETEKHAQSRGVAPVAELLGYGFTSDAYHITSPSQDGDGAYRAMKQALTMADTLPQEVGYINAHGTSTPTGDAVEAQAVARILGDHMGSVAMSSTKSVSGHLLGAAGALEAILSIEALRQELVPPTINLHEVDESVPREMNLVPHEAQTTKAHLALSNSFGFGGTNVSLLFKKT